jgi:hypothetical protein
MLLVPSVVPVAYSGILLHLAVANQSRAQPAGASAGIFGLTWSRNILGHRDDTDTYAVLVSKRPCVAPVC